MTQVNVASRKWRDAQGRERRFHYGLLIREAAAEPFFCEDYGVRVWEDGGEDASVPGITVSAQRVDELLSLLVEHRVSPAALADVVADWL